MSCECPFHRLEAERDSLRARAEAAEAEIEALRMASFEDRNRATSAEARVRELEEMYRCVYCTQTDELVSVLKDYVDEYGGIHEEECPEDDKRGGAGDV